MNSDDKYVLKNLPISIGNLWLPHLNLHMLYIKLGGNIVKYFSKPNSDLYM
jgi:hypothetical protein